MTGSVSRTKACRQQRTGVTLEDQHRMIHVLAVSAVEKAELLLAVGGIVGGVEIEQDLAALPDPLSTEVDELLAPSVLQAYQIGSRGRVLPAAERGLRAQRVTQFLVADDLQHWVVTQTASIVGIFVPGYDLIDTLPQQGERIVVHTIILARIAQAGGPMVGQMVAFIEGAQGQKAGITGDLATGKIGTDRLMTVEGEAQLW